MMVDTVATKLCRICGKPGQNYVNIFNCEGLKNKIETCLPVVVCPHSLLPDTICTECHDNVDNFFAFIKSCLQNILVLEKHYDVTESCLKTKRKHDRGCQVAPQQRQQRHDEDKAIQTDDYLELVLKDTEAFNLPPVTCLHPRLVDYDSSSSSSCEWEQRATAGNKTRSILMERLTARRYFDDAENYIIDEIAQRKRKRRSDNDATGKRMKLARNNGNKRKSRQPRKVVEHNHQDLKRPLDEGTSNDNLGYDCSFSNGDGQQFNGVHIDDDSSSINNKVPPQVCLLCDEQFSGPAILAAHVFESHGIDMAHILSLATAGSGGGEATPPCNDSTNGQQKKRLPNLVKISDLRSKSCDVADDQSEANNGAPPAQASEDPPTLLPSFVCPICPAVFTQRPDLFTHLRVKHPTQAAFLCGMCLHQSPTLQAHRGHVDSCAQHHQIFTRYVCQACRYGDDNAKQLESHVLVHDFLIEQCKQNTRMFDPADYVLLNDNYQRPLTTRFNNNNNNCGGLTCSECGFDDFESFKEFSAHRRSQHSIFHCDLCNKFYGRNSHLWKHVNRLHKGHPSITCQLCYKTSASKYHLAQHFNKIHNSATVKTTGGNNRKKCPQPPPLNENNDSGDFMSQKFQGFDFQSVKQSFMRQDLESQNAAPKEIDSSSDLYTNIITNYTPPVNEGEFKCPKCGKGFHKRPMLKKHKKNCRPRLQKDLLTRCKSCSRIFKDRQSLAKHLVNYHSEYTCEICDQKVQSKCEIVSHVRFSHPGCSLFCTICGNILRSEQDMADHLRAHDSSYVCQFCGDSLPSKIKLKMHILSLHRKILSLSCGVCLKLFESQHVLRDHVKLVHRDQLAPLTSCPVCGKNYGSKWKTYDHLNKSHGRIFRACKTCLEVFDSDAQLQAHVESAHSVCKVEQKVQVAPLNIKEETNGNNNSADEVQSDDLDDLDTNKFQLMFDDADVKPDVQSLLEKRLIHGGANSAAPKYGWEDCHSNAGGNPQHNSSKRTVYVNSNDPSFCEICYKTWPAKKHLWQHYIRCHKSVAATVCGICLKTNDSYAALQGHLRHTHPNLLHGQGFGSNFICRICGRYHNASSKLKLHMVIHEHFDWSILEEEEGEEEAGAMPPIDEDEAKQESGAAATNGGGDEAINYDSLIEQVECSSETSDESSSSDEEEDDNTTSSSKENEIKTEEVLSDDDDEEDDDGIYDSSSDDGYSVVKSGEDSCSSSSSSSSSASSSGSRDKPEVLHSAVESIKNEDTEDELSNSVDDDDEVIEQPSLNDNEIESAVGSIL